MQPMLEYAMWIMRRLHGWLANKLIKSFFENLHMLHHKLKTNKNRREKIPHRVKLKMRTLKLLRELNLSFFNFKLNNFLYI
jgi:hypothetical protein